MKSINQSVLFISAYLLLLTGCWTGTDNPSNFALLPQPQHFEISGPGRLKFDDVKHYHSLNAAELPYCGELLQGIQAVEEQARAEIIYGIDTQLDLVAEGYTLEISKEQIRINAKDEAGLLYAFMSLEQLLEDARDQDAALPECKIEDFPLLPYRVIHLDLKHHREKRDYYYQLFDKLASYKVNAIIVEMEDKIAYQRQPEVGSADALSIEEWKEMSEYAMARNIEISPLIQGLGHASFILKHDTYSELRDDPLSDWAFNPLDPRTYEVQFDLYLDAMEATPYGRYLHIGGDEVHTTGRGSGKTELELQLTWLTRVCEFAEEHGRIPIFWDDMPIKYAGLWASTRDMQLSKEDAARLWSENGSKLLENLDMFPKNCIYMRWNYSAPESQGNIAAMEWFVKNGLKVMGATAGQTRWSLMPRNESNMDNIKSFSLTSIDKGLDGLLLTLWDDDSPHFELYKRGIIFFAEYTWSGEKRSKEELKAAYRTREYSSEASNPQYAFIDLLEEQVNFWAEALLKKGRRSSVSKLDDPINQGIIDLPDEARKGEWSNKYADRLEQASQAVNNYEIIIAKISDLKSLPVRNPYTLEIYEQANELVNFTSSALLALKEYDSSENQQDEKAALERIRQLEDEFNSIRSTFEKVYSETRILSKPGNYILDQDHHNHQANQSISFDWQFNAELLLLEKIQETY